MQLLAKFKEILYILYMEFRVTLKNPSSCQKETRGRQVVSLLTEVGLYV